MTVTEWQPAVFESRVVNRAAVLRPRHMEAGDFDLCESVIKPAAIAGDGRTHWNRRLDPGIGQRSSLTYSWQEGFPATASAV